MDIVYAQEPLPDRVVKTIFLAGPTPEGGAPDSWRSQALRILEAHRYDGTVFVPEYRDAGFHGGELPESASWDPFTVAEGAPTSHYDAQVEWERNAMERADCILFWVPRSRTLLPGFTTNVEWGRWEGSGKVVLGFPPSAEKVRYLASYAGRYGVPRADTLEETVAHALAMVADGAERTGGECAVPLHIWQTPAFQRWYRMQVAAENALVRATVAWTRWSRPSRRLFAWGLDATLRIAAEDREKREMVIGRPDVVAVVLRNHVSFRDPDRNGIVLIREARPAAATADGCVHELPGGSSWDTAMDPMAVALEEVREETGLTLDPARLRPHTVRQAAATLSSYRVHAFSYDLTRNELVQLRAAEAAGTAFGDADATERTYVEIRSVDDIVERQLVDWANLGIILAVNG